VTDGLFEGEEAVLHVIERIVAPLGLRVDESSPWVDARLSDGSRCTPNFLAPDFAPFRLGHLRVSRCPVHELKALKCYQGAKWGPSNSSSVRIASGFLPRYTTIRVPAPYRCGFDQSMMAGPTMSALLFTDDCNLSNACRGQKLRSSA
jgi:hypothetical protein